MYVQINRVASLMSSCPGPMLTTLMKLLQYYIMYLCCSEPLDLRIDSKKSHCNKASLQKYDGDECDSGSTDGDPFRHCFTFPDGYRPVIDFQSFHPYSEQESVVSSDGEVIETTLPHFSEIQNPTESEKVSLYVRNTSLNPKKKRKIVRDSPSYVEKERRKPGRKPGQVSNVLHLWEFMRDLLHSSENQGIIEWISKPDGVFKVINSTEVARLWGEKKKNKKKMTYEKLSRSLRYSRLEGYFADLPRDKNYPKKLCFKFGPKSKDWH